METTVGVQSPLLNETTENQFEINYDSKFDELITQQKEIIENQEEIIANQKLSLEQDKAFHVKEDEFGNLYIEHFATLEGQNSLMLQNQDGQVLVDYSTNLDTIVQQQEKLYNSLNNAHDLGLTVSIGLGGVLIILLLFKMISPILR